jgi:hypothetical protein
VVDDDDDDDGGDVLRGLGVGVDDVLIVLAP